MIRQQSRHEEQPVQCDRRHEKDEKCPRFRESRQPEYDRAYRVSDGPPSVSDDNGPDGLARAVEKQGQSGRAPQVSHESNVVAMVKIPAAATGEDTMVVSFQDAYVAHVAVERTRRNLKFAHGARSPFGLDVVERHERQNARIDADKVNKIPHNVDGSEHEKRAENEANFERESSRHLGQ